jgi:hypothetical protein
MSDGLTVDLKSEKFEKPLKDASDGLMGDLKSEQKDIGWADIWYDVR